MKKNLLLLWIIFSALSCKKDTATTPVTGDFKTGSSWVYKRIDYNEAGAVVSSNNIALTITGQQTLLGETWWVLSASGSPAGLLRKATTGFYTVTNNVSQLQFKIPATVNDTWRVTYSATAGDYSDFKVMAVNENVTVPMGTIPCYYIEGNDSNSLEDKEWYNDANTLVKQIEYNQNSSGALYVNFTMELVSFTP